MSTEIRVTFPWGLYHATPWNRSTNEGAVEWPPSPWRLLRALYSGWKLHATHVPAERAETILGRLAAAPSFNLPPHTVGHTRHYLPGIAHLAGVKADTDKTLDAFVAMPRGASIDLRWDVDLDEPEREALAEMASGVRYLGRAESVVEVSLLSAGCGGPPNCEPNVAAIEGTRQVLAAEPPLDLDALVMTPLQVRSSRRLQPPSTRWIDYPAPEVVRRTPRRPNPTIRSADAVRFALGGRLLPSKYDLVWVAHLMHRAAVARCATRTLSGKDDEGSPLGGRHGHVHYFVTSSTDDPRRVDTVVAWAPDGFTAAEEAALSSMRVLNSPDFVDGVSSRRVTALVSGAVDAIAPELVGPSRVWESLTPYAPSAHHKGSAEEQLAKDITRELAHRGLPAPSAVRFTDGRRGDWLRYKRYRPGRERLASSRRAVGARIEFSEPLGGPLALGQLSHFGLGLFVPVPEDG